MEQVRGLFANAGAALVTVYLVSRGTSLVLAVGKEPHFRPFELMFLSGFGLFTPLRTMLFIWMVTIPSAGIRRGIIVGTYT